MAWTSSSSMRKLLPNRGLRRAGFMWSRDLLWCRGSVLGEHQFRTDWTRFSLMQIMPFFTRLEANSGQGAAFQWTVGIFGDQLFQCSGIILTVGPQYWTETHIGPTGSGHSAGSCRLHVLLEGFSHSRSFRVLYFSRFHRYRVRWGT